MRWLVCVEERGRHIEVTESPGTVDINQPGSRVCRTDMSMCIAFGLQGFSADGYYFLFHYALVNALYR